MKNWSVWIWIGVFIIMIIISMTIGALFDKSDWIFLVIISGSIFLGNKLDKILKLLEKKNLKKK